MYKVFYKDRTVFFIENDSKITNQSILNTHTYINKGSVQQAINEFLITEYDFLYVLCNDVEQAFKEYSSLYTVIEAAGGLVKNSKNEILFIYRREKWDLPKGKVESNETPEIGAVREVEEECGINNLEITRFLTTTYHTYTLNNVNILKPSHWFEMYYEGNEKLTPQLDEEITEAIWLDTNKTEKIISNTFPSIIDVLKKSGTIN